MRILLALLLVIVLTSCKSGIHGNFKNQYGHKLQLKDNRFILITYDGLTAAEIFSYGSIYLSEERTINLISDELIPFINLNEINSKNKPTLILYDDLHRTKYSIIADSQDIRPTIMSEIPTPESLKVISTYGTTFLDTVLSKNKSYEMEIIKPLGVFQMDTMQLRIVSNRKLKNDLYKFKKSN